MDTSDTSLRLGLRSCNSSSNVLASALVKKRMRLPLRYGSTNPFCKNRYASFNSVMEACREALLKHNIWLTHLPVPAPAEYGVNHIAPCLQSSPMQNPASGRHHLQ